jgi:hypothetical protein
MAKKIKITSKQLEEAMDVFVNKTNNETDEQALKRTRKETEQQVGNKDVNYIIPSNESKIFSKSQILEARRKFLKENSTNYTKSHFLNKK